MVQQLTIFWDKIRNPIDYQEGHADGVADQRPAVFAVPERLLGEWADERVGERLRDASPAASAAAADSDGVLGS